MANLETIIIGSEKIIKPSSFWWGLDEGVFMVSAYGYSPEAKGRAEYFVESCSIVNPQTGCEKNFNPFGYSTDFNSDPLYDDISRFRITESFVDSFDGTFPGHNLEGSEFAVALTAHAFEQMGYIPWIVIQPDKNNLIEFCKDKGWVFTVLSNRKDHVPQNVQEIINNIVSSRNITETRLISSRESY